jgi:hypothetical protein
MTQTLYAHMNKRRKKKKEKELCEVMDVLIDLIFCNHFTMYISNKSPSYILYYFKILFLYINCAKMLHCFIYMYIIYFDQIHTLYDSFLFLLPHILEQFLVGFIILF